MAAGVVPGDQLEASALLVVQDGGEDARGVEPREAEPFYGSVDPDQRSRVQVAYHPVILYREVPHAPLLVRYFSPIGWPPYSWRMTATALAQGRSASRDS